MLNFWTEIDFFHAVIPDAAEQKGFLLMAEGLTYEIDAEHGLPLFQQWLHYG